MKILFFGDLVGRPARNILKQVLPEYKKKYKPDLIIANSDNLAHGRGVTKNTVKEILENGVDLATSGDHIWDTSQAIDIINSNEYNLICPANFPVIEDEKGYKIIEINAKKVLIVNLMGRVFFQKHPDCPFRTVDRILKNAGDVSDIIIVDFHCEATSEKRAMGFYLNSRVSAVIGTHTHVQTSDEEVLSGGTAYISDAGMVGPKDSILGCDKNSVIDHMLLQIPFRYKISDDKKVMVNAILVDVDDKSGKAENIKRINDVFQHTI